MAEKLDPNKASPSRNCSRPRDQLVEPIKMCTKNDDATSALGEINWEVLEDITAARREMEGNHGREVMAARSYSGKAR